MPKSSFDESDHDSDWSSNDGSYSEDDDHSSSFDNDNDEYFRNEGMSRLISSIRRRTVFGGRPSSIDNGNDDEDGGDCNENRKKTKQRGNIATCFRTYHERCPELCNQRVATAILLLSFAIWITVKKTYTPFVGHTMSPRDRSYAESVKERMKRAKQVNLKIQEIRKQRSERMGEGGIFSKVTEGYNKILKPSSKREFPEECQPEPWQTRSFPSCNDIHEIDLNDLRPTLFNPSSDLPPGKYGREQPKYIGSGLWRDVFRFQPRLNPGSSSADERAVLKIMKGEHDVDDRNLDRHRRDAMVMERLSSKNVVKIFGFCGNTVMTEYIEQDLDNLIKQNFENSTSVTPPTRNTPLGRLQLALGASKGLAALHEFSGGPIIHADIQSKQFLVDAEGNVKLNDFNRCRFMPRNNQTGEFCKIRIPTAPGNNRSPEEYNSDLLDEKLDVYSLANVIYQILTCSKVWFDEGTKSIKRMVREGKKPKMLPLKPGTSDASLAVLMELAYARDPAQRISAAGLVHELEILVEAEQGKG